MGFFVFMFDYRPWSAERRNAVVIAPRDVERLGDLDL